MKVEEGVIGCLRVSVLAADRLVGCHVALYHTRRACSSQPIADASHFSVVPAPADCAADRPRDDAALAAAAVRPGYDLEEITVGVLEVHAAPAVFHPLPGSSDSICLTEREALVV
jgi:hypothetical protein